MVIDHSASMGRAGTLLRFVHSCFGPAKSNGETG